MGRARELARLPSRNADAKAGTISPFGGASAPDGWLLCYGQAVSRTTYADLFTAIGTTHGAGDGSTTFNLPDLRGRSAFGKDDMGGSAASRVTNGNSGITGTTLGAAGGDERMHAHTHNYGYGDQAAAAGGVGTLSRTANNAQNAGASTTAGAGGSQNMPPAMVLNYIIKT